ncbi:MAG: hypothetical protein RL385_1465 [Pseudomonadota bacterium]
MTTHSIARARTEGAWSPVRKAAALAGCLAMAAQLGFPRVLAEEPAGLHAAAQAAYERKDYDHAIALLSDAKRTRSAPPELDFNLGVTAQAAGRYSLAAAHFRSYADALPVGSARDVRAHADALTRFSAWQANPHAAQRRRLPWWGWGLIVGGGVSLIAVAAALAADTGSTGDEY